MPQCRATGAGLCPGGRPPLRVRHRRFRLEDGTWRWSSTWRAHRGPRRGRRPPNAATRFWMAATCERERPAADLAARRRRRGRVHPRRCMLRRQPGNVEARLGRSSRPTRPTTAARTSRGGSRSRAGSRPGSSSSICRKPDARRRCGLPARRGRGRPAPTAMAHSRRIASGAPGARRPIRRIGPAIRGAPQEDRRVQRHPRPRACALVNRCSVEFAVMANSIEAYPTGTIAMVPARTSAPHPATASNAPNAE